MTGRQRRAALLALAAAAAVAAGACTPASPATASARYVRQAATGTAPLRWLATGDSYSSGEGITGTGKTGDACAQSRSAYGPRAFALLAAQRGLAFDASRSAFSACTGHLTGDFWNEHLIAPGKGSGKGSLYDWTVEQAGARPTFDMVTFSFGGNDVGFADLVSDCIDLPPDWTQIRHLGPDGCRPSLDELERRVDRYVDGDVAALVKSGALKQGNEFGPHGKKASLVSFYRGIAERLLRQGGVLVVVGYPRLFAPSEEWPRWRNGICERAWDVDADMLGAAGEYFESKLGDAVREADAGLTGGRHVVFESRLAEFDADGGHSLCSPTGSEWLNGITLGTSAGIRFMHSFHPNERGHQVTAEKVAQVFADTWVGPTASSSSAVPVPRASAPVETSVTSSRPAIRDPGPRYEPGSPFHAACVVAWPTAPTYTSTSIVMTMSCSGVPQQFLFVQVTYPDPNLPVTPSTGRMDVRGTVVDTATSAYGYTELVVQADAVTIP